MSNGSLPAVRIGKGIGDVSESTLRFYRQIGVEEVGIPSRFQTAVRGRPLVPPTQTGAHGAQPPPWDVDELRRICATVRAHDLLPTHMSLPLSHDVLTGGPDRARDLERIRASIHAAGQAGIRVMTYSFTALRASEGYGAMPEGGRGGATLRDFDAARIDGLPPLPDVGRHGLDEMWDHLLTFLRAVVPVAEEHRIRLAAHPNDPPVPEYRGVAQPLADLASWRRLIDAVDSPSNCLFFDTGVTTELGEDAVEVIHTLGHRGRIGTVHFRNVRVIEPRRRYVETFIDGGNADMLACMRAFFEVGYEGALDPDHTPGIAGDREEEDTHAGWAYAVGQMRAMRAAAMTWPQGRC